MKDDRVEFNPYKVDVPRLLSALGIRAEHVGDRWIARCPARQHPDNKPSWDIKDNPGHERHGLHSCFSCNFGGNSIELVRKVVGLASYRGAIDWIIERAMGSAPILQSVAVDVIARGAPFCLPPGVVVAPLEEWPGPVALYLAAEHPITAAQVARWGLGYAIAGRLAGRVVVPSRDRLGRPVHYTARTFIDSPKRYLEPKREEGPDPGAIFGEQHWPPEGQRDLVVVTEGAFNALAAERVATVPVASLFGSNVNVQHLQKLATFRRGLLLTDPDPAGERAAEKIRMALARYLRMTRVEIPLGEDADSIEPSELRAALVRAVRFVVKPV